jgi:cobalt/nickel transport protein
VRTRWVVVVGLALALALAGVVSFFASTAPDGLSRVATDKGFSHTAEEHDAVSDRVPAGVARVGGLVIVLALGGGVAYAVRRRRSGSTE